MNRRQLLRTLSVLTAGSACAAFSNASFAAEFSIPLSPDDRALLLALAQSKAVCDLMLRENAHTPERCSSGSVKCLKETSALINQAHSRLLDQSLHGPAFWQACSDALVRAAEQLETICTIERPGGGGFGQAQSTFRQTAQLLKVETVRAAGICGFN